jgi:fused signal recognition particle receptor
MGFFSKIKKIWKTDKTDDQEALPFSEEHLDDVSQEIETESTESEEKILELEDIQKVTETAIPEQQPIAPDTKDSEAWQKDLMLALQESEPRLSIWLDHILEGVSTAENHLWDRLSFLFQNLEVPEEEAQDFISRFQKWLDDMEYEHVHEFRSELQYRLALALDLEDEEDEQSRLFLKLSEGLSKTKENLSKRIDTLLNTNPNFDDQFWDNLEEILIMADIGFQTTTLLVERLQNKVRGKNSLSPEDFKTLFQEELAFLFPKPPKKIKPIPPEVILMIGVNGVGKTTTIAKLAHRAQMQGKKVLIAAGDTFRAAAIEQLEIWANRVGTDFYAKEFHSDPAAVAYEALEKAQKEHIDTLIVDTAGRLHTKIDLMDELKKIKRVLQKKHPGAPHRTILVVDATTGQNAISQTKLFHQGISIDEIILTKLDGTAKGGVVLSIAYEHNLPITYIGLGEKMEDLRPFNGQDFAKALLE